VRLDIVRQAVRLFPIGPVVNRSGQGEEFGRGQNLRDDALRLLGFPVQVLSSPYTMWLAEP